MCKICAYGPDTINAILWFEGPTSMGFDLDDARQLKIAEGEELYEIEERAHRDTE